MRWVQDARSASKWQTISAERLTLHEQFFYWHAETGVARWDPPPTGNDDLSSIPDPDDDADTTAASAEVRPASITSPRSGRSLPSKPASPPPNPTSPPVHSSANPSGAVSRSSSIEEETGGAFSDAPIEMITPRTRQPSVRAGGAGASLLAAATSMVPTKQGASSAAAAVATPTSPSQPQHPGTSAHDGSPASSPVAAVHDSSLPDWGTRLVILDDCGDGRPRWALKPDEQGQIEVLLSIGCVILGNAELAGAEAPKKQGPAENEWRQISRDDGTTYFHNLKNGKTSWVLPPGGVVVARVRPKTVVRATATVLLAANKFKMKLARRQSQAATASLANDDEASPEGDTKEDASVADLSPARRTAPKEFAGWWHKTPPVKDGKPPASGWKKRWMVLNSAEQCLQYFNSNPKVTFERMGVIEPEKGRLSIAGATIHEVTDSAAMTAAAAPSRFVVRVVDKDRETWLAMDSMTGGKTAYVMWAEALRKCAAAPSTVDEPRSSTPGSGAGASGAGASSPSAAAAAPVLGTAEADAVDSAVRAAMSRVEAIDAAFATVACNASGNGHVWTSAVARVYPAARMVVIGSPDESVGKAGAAVVSPDWMGSSLASRGSPGAAALLPGGRVQLPLGVGLLGARIRAQTDSRGPIISIVDVGALDDSATIELRMNSAQDLVMWAHMLRFLAQQPMPDQSFAKALLGDESLRPGAVLQVRVWEQPAGALSTGWRPRQLQLVPAAGLVRVLREEDAATATSAAERDAMASFRLDVATLSAEERDGLLLATGTGSSRAAPSALTLRIGSGKQSTMLACKSWDDFCIALGGCSAVYLVGSRGSTSLPTPKEAEARRSGGGGGLFRSIMAAIRSRG